LYKLEHECRGVAICIIKSISLQSITAHFCFRKRRRFDSISDYNITVDFAGRCRLAARNTSMQIFQSEEDDER